MTKNRPRPQSDQVGPQAIFEVATNKFKLFLGAVKLIFLILTIFKDLLKYIRNTAFEKQII